MRPSAREREGETQHHPTSPFAVDLTPAGPPYVLDFFIILILEQVGTDAPPFSVKNQDGVEVAMESFKGNKNVVVYFYPKDNTVSLVNGLPSQFSLRSCAMYMRLFR